jgi:hypothetical protein
MRTELVRIGIIGRHWSKRTVMRIGLERIRLEVYLNGTYQLEVYLDGTYQLAV